MLYPFSILLTVLIHPHLRFVLPRLSPGLSLSASSWPRRRWPRWAGRLRGPPVGAAAAGSPTATDPPSRAAGRPPISPWPPWSEAEKSGSEPGPSSEILGRKNHGCEKERRVGPFFHGEKDETVRWNGVVHFQTNSLSVDAFKFHASQGVTRKVWFPRGKLDYLMSKLVECLGRSCHCHCSKPISFFCSGNQPWAHYWGLHMWFTQSKPSSISRYCWY